ncbi:hypothetical protein QUA81_13305 [Microcoleus sp. F6_B4]
MVLTAGLATKLLRSTIADYNYWPQSESDSPLSIKRAKQPFDEPAILSRDASMRRAALKAMNPLLTTYKPPTNRRIEYKTLHEVFQPLIKNALDELATVSEPLAGEMPAPEAYFSILMPIEAVEYLTEIYQTFSQLQNTKVVLVHDDDGDNTSPDAYTTLMIAGESAEYEIILAQAVLIQT